MPHENPAIRKPRAPLYTSAFILMSGANFFMVCGLASFFLFPLFITERGGTQIDVGLLMGVMAQVGVPPDGIALILGADRLLDMGRTVINVEGDLAAAVCVEAFEARREAA